MTAAVVAAAVADPAVLARYRAKVWRGDPGGCWYWLGAISTPSGHGRFWIASLGEPDRRRGLVVIAHRFGWALAHGHAALAAAGMLTHTCDEPSCQNPSHLAPGDSWSNRHDWLIRRQVPRSPLRDVRGPAARARAIRAALIASPGAADLRRAQHDGISALDRGQLPLW